MQAMENDLIELSILGVDGSSTNILVERGTTAAMILGHRAIRSPAGYQARLVDESAQAVEHDAKIWQPQASI